MFEKVNPQHPDKVADRIAGALVDIAYGIEDDPRIAVEVLLGHGVCHIIAETSVRLPVRKVARAVRRIAGTMATRLNMMRKLFLRPEKCGIFDLQTKKAGKCLVVSENNSTFALALSTMLFKS